ncbi:hypothetical protein B0H13DRAFT_2681444 [Mycena leptocephala]|nr:hypothetical protein B0H13DRAFT_2681444 [Mycena leptocephala]
MPLVAAALTFGSFGDILEAAKIAKHIVDVLRNGASDSEARRRQKLISTLEGICDDMAKLTFLFDAGCFTDRLCAEVDLCRSLLDEFYAKINSYKAAGLRGLLGRTWMVAVEEKELASWRAQISERRAALHDLLCSLNSIQLHDVSDQVRRVGSQVQYIGSRVDSIKAQVQEVGTLGVILSTYLSSQVSQQGSEIREAVSEIRQVCTGGQQLPGTMSLRNIPDPVFFIMDPLGRPITVQLSHCSSFHDLDRILKAYLSTCPDAGSQYVNRGDYNIVSTEGTIVPRSNFRRAVGAWMKFEMSIIKRMPDPSRQEIHQSCPSVAKPTQRPLKVVGSFVLHAGRNIKFLCNPECQQLKKPGCQRLKKFHPHKY